MLLIFGKKTVETKGLPRVSVMNTHGHSEGVTVYVLLESRTRAAVEKWAKRLGVEVTEEPAYHAHELEISAKAESDGSRLHVYTYVSAAPAKDQGQDPAPVPLHWPARGLRTTTLCQGEPLTAESFAASEAEVTCPGCRALLPGAPRDTTGSAS